MLRPMCSVLHLQVSSCTVQAQAAGDSNLLHMQYISADAVWLGVQADREQLTQLMFEEFNMTGFFLCDQPILSLYAVGKITGTVVDIGHAKTGKVFLLLIMSHYDMHVCKPWCMQCVHQSQLHAFTWVLKCNICQPPGIVVGSHISAQAHQNTYFTVLPCAYFIAHGCISTWQALSCRYCSSSRGASVIPLQQALELWRQGRRQISASAAGQAGHKVQLCICLAEAQGSLHQAPKS